ncbi:MAG: serpin family protein [Candidatus Omnitrophota bacterium]
MKRLLLCSLVLFSGLLFLFSSLFAEDANSVVDANNQFAFELYARYKSSEENIFFSPYSISSALAMAYEGAEGTTADEIQAVFHFPKDDSLRREEFQRINNRINRKDKKYELHIANALWAQKDYLFLEEYFNLIENYYAGKVTNLDFVNETEKSRLSINNWVVEQTNNKIKGLIPSGVLGELTRLVLTNAIYFKGAWFEQFGRKYTKEEDFRVSPGNIVKVQMMSLSGEEFNYAETEQVQVLELPYDGKELSMLIFLPKNDDLESVEASLNAQKLSEWKNSLKRERVDVYLPKFKFENKYFIKGTLKEMGMATAFTLGIDFGGKADFSGMTGKKDLNIDEVIHQSFIAVNEEGTEAAAVTAVVIDVGAVWPPQPREIKIFKADHPFIFIIEEKKTGNILFLGRVSDPNA